MARGISAGGDPAGRETQSIAVAMSRAIDRAFAAFDGLLQRPPIWMAFALALIALQTALIVTHEPWADEYQALLIAAQAPDLATMLDWLRYEGHPPLWYLLLRGLDTILPALDTLWIAALVCAAIVQGIILFASPFSRAERLTFGASQFVLFEFLTVSRGTTLGVALIFLALLAWRNRWFWLVLVLLPFVDFLFGVLSGVLLLLKLRERDFWLPGIALWLLSGVAAAWTVLPAPDAVSAFKMFPFDQSHTEWFRKLSGVALPFQGGIAPQWNSPIHPVGGIAWIGFVALCWVQTRHDRLHLLMIFGFLGLTLAFSLLLYPMGVRHLMIAALLLMLLAWRDGRDAGRASTPWFRLWLAIAALAGLATSAIAFTKPFDTADKALAEIERRGLADAHWMAFPDWRTPALTARRGMTFERIERHCMTSLIRWDYRIGIYEPHLLEAHLREEIARHGRSYLVSDRKLDAVSAEVLAPLASIDAGYDGLPYHFYIVGPDSVEKPASLPPCVEGTVPLDHWPRRRLGKK